jgi:hypothetical protein
MVQTLASLGPTFVKLAQLFAGRADIIPEPYVSAIGTLTDRVPGVPAAKIRASLIESYGAPPETVFEFFDVQPLAAASLGQVHRARVDGREVVVKVLRPGVERLVAGDSHVPEQAAFDLAFADVAGAITAQPDFRGQGLIGETITFAALLFWTVAFTMSRESQRLEKRLGVGVR